MPDAPWFFWMATFLGASFALGWALQALHKLVTTPCAGLEDDHWRHLWHDYGAEYTHLQCLNCEQWKAKTPKLSPPTEK